MDWFKVEQRMPPRNIFVLMKLTDLCQFNEINITLGALYEWEHGNSKEWVVVDSSLNDDFLTISDIEYWCPFQCLGKVLQCSLVRDANECYFFEKRWRPDDGLV